MVTRAMRRSSRSQRKGSTLLSQLFQDPENWSGPGNRSTELTLSTIRKIKKAYHKSKVSLNTISFSRSLELSAVTNFGLAVSKRSHSGVPARSQRAGKQWGEREGVFSCLPSHISLRRPYNLNPWNRLINSYSSRARWIWVGYLPSQQARLE